LLLNYLIRFVPSYKYKPNVLSECKDVRLFLEKCRALLLSTSPSVVIASVRAICILTPEEFWKSLAEPVIRSEKILKKFKKKSNNLNC
jgi:hypothetical protein